MQGLYFALSVLAVGLVIGWCFRAEKRPEAVYQGIFAMTRPKTGLADKPEKSKRKKFRLTRLRSG